ELAEAARVWEEVVDTRRVGDGREGLGEAERRLATVYDLSGAAERAAAARIRAADVFAARGLIAEAATERLTVAAHLQATGRLSAALGLLLEISDQGGAGGWERPGLRARALALEGQVRTKLGQGTAGVALVRSALSLALTENATSAAAEAY